MTPLRIKFIVLNASGKWLTARRIERQGQFPSVASAWETSPANQFAAPWREKTVRNRKPVVVPIPVSTGNTGLWTTPTIAFYEPLYLATSRGCCAICAPAGQPSLIRSSLIVRKVTIFTPVKCLSHERNKILASGLNDVLTDVELRKPLEMEPMEFGNVERRTQREGTTSQR